MTAPRAPGETCVRVVASGARATTTPSRSRSAAPTASSGRARSAGRPRARSRRSPCSRCRRGPSSGSCAATADAWTIDTLTPATTEPDVGYVESAGFSPDGARLLVVREARVAGRPTRKFQVLDASTLAVELQASDVTKPLGLQALASRVVEGRHAGAAVTTMGFVDLVALLISLTAADMGDDPVVTREGTRGGDANVTFPHGSVEVGPRIHGDGGTLDLERSLNGRELWSRRHWDDGSTDVTHFVLTPSRADHRRLVLQFIDGVTNAIDRPQHGTPTAGLLYKELEQWRELMLTAWAIDPEGLRAFDPKRGDWIPLVPAVRNRVNDARALHWMTFVGSCRETSGPCVYFGDPGDVRFRFLDAAPFAEQHTWIAPPLKARHSICISRAENNGLMNSAPVRIIARKGGREELLGELRGGEYGCARLAPGDLILQARSIDAYSTAKPDPGACRSDPLRVALVARRSSSVGVTPKSAGSTWLCGWTLSWLE